jgi:hypothetical protein
LKIAKSLLEIVKSLKDLNYLTEIFEDFEELTDRDRKELKYYAKTKLKEMHELAKVLKTAEEEEATSSIINLWFEWRSEWIRYNAVNNFNMVEFGEANNMSVVKSGYVSFLISKIESLIPEEKLEKIHEIMVQVQYESG